MVIVLEYAQNTEALILALKYKADINVKNREGKTVLDLNDDYSKASPNSPARKEIESILLKHGAKRAKDL